MPTHPLRIQKEDEVYYVRNHCVLDTFMMIPTDEINVLIGGALARATARHGTLVYVFSFVHNEFEMMVGAPRLNLPEFMKTLQQEIAFGLNDVHDRDGKVFAGRYQKSEVRGQEAMLERYSAITCAPVHAGLVATPREWAGVASWKNFLSGDPFKGMSLDRTELGKLKKKAQNKRKTFELPRDAGHRHYEFQLSRLPGFEPQTDAEYRALIQERVEARTQEYQQMHGGRYMDLDKLRQMHWSARALKDVERDYQLCYGTQATRAEHEAEYKAICKTYAAAMKAYLEEDDASKFPVRTCRPGIYVCEKPEGWPKRA